MATHSSILAWRIPWTEEPGVLQSTGSQRVRYHRSDLAQHILSKEFQCIISLNVKQILLLLFIKENIEANDTHTVQIPLLLRGFEPKTQVLNSVQ